MPYRSMLDHFFQSPRPLFSLSDRVWNPPTDIYENDTTTTIKMEVAGLEDSEFDITAQKNLLIVRGRREQATESGKVNFHLMEVHYGEFERVFAFSFPVSEDTIKATYDKGFLCIQVAKRPPQVTNVAVQIIPDAGDPQS